MKGTSYGQYVKMAKRVAERAKDKRPQYARVRQVDGVRVDLVVGQSQTVIRNAEVIGDASQLKTGDTVQIAWWNGDRPVAIAGTQLTDINGRMDEAEKKLDAINITRPTSTPNNTGGIADWQILRFSKGALASVHAPDEAGLRDAADLCIDGDMVLIPALDLELDKTVDPVQFVGKITVQGLSRASTILRGQVEIALGCTLSGMTVIRLDNVDDADLVAVFSDGTCKITDCEIHALNCGAGGAYGLDLATSARVTIRNSYLTGESEIGEGYAIRGVDATIYDSQVYGTTAQYTDANQIRVYGTTEGDPVIEKYIEIYGCPNWPPDNGGGDETIPPGITLYAEISVVGAPFNIPAGQQSVAAATGLFGAGLDDYNIYADTHNFFGGVLTDATLVIPYTGRWRIVLRNLATLGLSGWSSDDLFGWNNSISILGQTLSVSGQTNGWEGFAAIPGACVWTEINPPIAQGYMDSYDYVMDVDLVQGQRVQITINTNIVNIQSIGAAEGYAGSVPHSRIMICPTPAGA